MVDTHVNNYNKFIPRIISVLAKTNLGFPVSNFLSDILTALEKSGVSFLSTAVFGFFSLYLLWCT